MHPIVQFINEYIENDAVGWGQGPWALVNPVKAIWVQVGVIKNNIKNDHALQWLFNAKLNLNKGQIKSEL